MAELAQPDKPAGFVETVNKDGTALRNDRRVLKPAEQNRWYVLATIAGVQEGRFRFWEIDNDLAARNRRYWNGWACSGLDDADRAALAEKIGLPPADLAPLSGDEQRTLEQELHKRLGPEVAIPAPSERLDFEDTHFPHTSVWKKCVFPADANFESATFSGAALFGSATFSGDAWFGPRRSAGMPGSGPRRSAGLPGSGPRRSAGLPLFGSATFSGDCLVRVRDVQRGCLVRVRDVQRGCLVRVRDVQRVCRCSSSTRCSGRGGVSRCAVREPTSFRGAAFEARFQPGGHVLHEDTDFAAMTGGVKTRTARTSRTGVARDAGKSGGGPIVRLRQC